MLGSIVVNIPKTRSVPYSIMGTFFCLIVSLFVSITASSAQDWEGNADNGFGLCWFWVGSDVGGVIDPKYPSLGMPKFKLCKHPNGGSLQVGMDDNFMRVRISDELAKVPYNKYTIPTIDYKIKGYKGTVKYNITRRTPEGPGFVVEADMFEPLLHDTKYPWELEEKTVGGKIQLKYEPPTTSQTPYTLELTIIGNAFTELLMHASYPSNAFTIPEHSPPLILKDLKYTEAVLRLTFNPHKMEDTAADLKLIINGDVDNSWGKGPANYSLSSSLAITSIVRPTNSERQPRMTAEWNVAEDLVFEEGNPEFSRIPRSNKLFSKKVVFDGMINLTEQGDRIAVLKFTDADTNKTFGRIQARKADDENLRLELFWNGKQKTALNLEQQASGITKVTFEDYVTDKLCDETNNHTNCKVNRLFDTLVNKGVSEIIVYQDLHYAVLEAIGIGPNRQWKKLKEENQGVSGLFDWMVLDGKLLGAKLETKNGTVECSSNFALNGHRVYGNKGVIKNDGQNTNLKYRETWQNGREIPEYENKMDVEIKPTSTGDNYNLELKYNTVEQQPKQPKKNRTFTTSFDGWYELTNMIQKMVAETVPNMEKYLNSIYVDHDRFYSNLISDIPKSINDVVTKK